MLRQRLFLERGGGRGALGRRTREVARGEGFKGRRTREVESLGGEV